MNELKICIEQTESGKLLSRLTLEYPDLSNQYANRTQLEFIEGMMATARRLDELKNGPFELPAASVKPAAAGALR